MNQKQHIYSDWNNVVSENRNNLVFSYRNKSYGAYWIRQNYNRLTVIAFLISAGCLIIAITAPLIYQWMNGYHEDQPSAGKEISIEFISLPPVIPVLPPPLAPPPPPVAQQIKFTPLVVSDKPLPEEQQLLPQDELTNKTIGTIPNDSGSTIRPPTVPDIKSKGTNTDIPVWVQEMPKFPGGEEKLLQFIQKNFRYPVLARENGIQGRITVRFVVDENGKVKMVNVPKGTGVGGGCDEEAIRVVSILPDWIPGKQNGHAVPVWYTVPVLVQLR